MTGRSKEISNTFLTQSGGVLVNPTKISRRADGGLDWDTWAVGISGIPVLLPDVSALGIDTEVAARRVPDHRMPALGNPDRGFLRN